MQPYIYIFGGYSLSELNLAFFESFLLMSLTGLSSFFETGGLLQGLGVGKGCRCEWLRGLCGFSFFLGGTLKNFCWWSGGGGCAGARFRGGGSVVFWIRPRFWMGLGKSLGFDFSAVFHRRLVQPRRSRKEAKITL